jgi:hypothetical protein
VEIKKPFWCSERFFYCNGKQENGLLIYPEPFAPYF